jgi:hypothetical protein
MEAERRATLVLGPHRSGTSVVARAVATTGAVFGRHLLEANDDNPRGFFENEKIVSLNDRMLRALNTSWDAALGFRLHPGEHPEAHQWRNDAAQILASEFGDAERICVKDPRLSLLGSFWTEALSEAGFSLQVVLTLRDPRECAASQATRVASNRRYQFLGATEAEGALLWLRYMHGAMEVCRAQPSVLASYDRFVDEPRAALEDLLAALREDATESARKDFCAHFVSADLRRSHARPGDSSPLMDAASSAFRVFARIPQERRMPADAMQAASRLLPEVLGPAHESAEAINQAFVRARHAAVEANLQLDEAQAIITYQEDGLKRALGELEETQRIVAYQESAMADLEERAREAERIVAYQQALITARDEQISEQRATMVVRPSIRLRNLGRRIRNLLQSRRSER